LPAFFYFIRYFRRRSVVRVPSTRHSLLLETARIK
jgi:hypothetical protein